MIEQQGIAIRPSGIREYSEEFKADALTALELNEGNVRLTARKLGIPDDTLYSWSNGVGISQHVLRLQAGVKGPLADRFEETARLYLEHAQKPEIIARTSGYYAVVGASDAMKSSQLLRNLPTSITLDLNGTDLASVLQGVLGEVIDVTPETPTE